ncbi:unnamed protein product [Brachionus calyciflorus]|uniref:Uncharacterized protein n=1 Tax=Brachionus calyciflorus TaxID=104777 RepID=A0A814JRJ8_9BILA|nr:unnamed protein product [Brachionus calyciflorus]
MVNQTDILTILILNITKPLPKNSNYISLISKNLSENIRDLNKKVYILNRESVANNGNNYYVGGVVFMVSVLGLLMYVNFYYENCFTDSCLDLSKIPCCCCVRLLFKYRIFNLETPQIIQNKTKRTVSLLESPTSTTFATEKIEALNKI